MKALLWIIGTPIALFLLFVAKEAIDPTPQRTIAEKCRDASQGDKQLEYQCMVTAAFKYADQRDQARADKISRALSGP